MTALVILLMILVGLAALGFMGGIVAAGIFTIRETPGTFPSFASEAVTAIGGVLATNLGAVLGLTFASIPGKRAALRPWNGLTTESLQKIAAYLYVVGLVTAAVFWGVKGFSDETTKVVSTLPELTRTLLGVIVGALAVAVGVARRRSSATSH